MYGYFLPTDIEQEVPVAFVYSFKVKTSAGERLPENPVLVDLYEGKVYKIKGETDEKGDTVYNDLPVAEYPVIICSADMVEIVK